MKNSDWVTLVIAVAGFGIAIWLFRRWDERRMDREVEKAYPKPAEVTPQKPRLSWDEKKKALEAGLQRSHEVSDDQALAPYIGFLVALALGFNFFGAAGLLIGIPFGVALYYSVRAWTRRGRAKAAKALADHLGQDRDGTFPS